MAQNLEFFEKLLLTMDQDLDFFNNNYSYGAGLKIFRKKNFLIMGQDLDFFQQQFFTMA